MTVTDQYQFDKIRNVSDYFTLPSSTLYRDLYHLKKDAYEPNERIIFTCMDFLSDELLKTFLRQLQRCVGFLDISHFFVLVITNRSWVVDYLKEIKHLGLNSESDPIGSIFQNEVIHGDVVIDPKIMLEPPDTICTQPWISLDVSNGGHFAPCCFYSDTIRDTSGRQYHAETDSFESVYNSPHMQQLREDFRVGLKPAGCVRCWKEEADGATSKRQLLKHRFGEYGFSSNWEQDEIDNLKVLSVCFGNICNLKCRICTPDASSKIAQEGSFHISLQNGQWIQNNNAQVWQDLIDNNIVYLDLSGGEPMLNIKHFKILEQLVEQGQARDISIHYNTNGTTFPDKYIDLLKKFKQIDIALSIDDIGARYEYQRKGAVWSEVVDNLNQFFSIKSSNVTIGLHSVVNIQNVFYLPEICDWVKKQSFDSVHFSTLYIPEYLSIVNLTAEAKELVINKLSNYTSGNNTLDQFIEQTITAIDQSVPANPTKFVEYMKQLDLKRNENFSDEHAEIANAMKYHV